MELPFGAFLGDFRETFRPFWEVSGFLLDATHSRAKTYISRFGRSPDGTCSRIFRGVDSGVCFNEILCDFWRFGRAFGLPLAFPGAPHLGYIGLPGRG